MKYLLLSTLITAMMISGCASGSSQSRQSSVTAPSTTPNEPSIKGRLDTDQYEFAPTWIPVQPVPQFKERRSLTAEDTWPKNNDEVEVLCKTAGGPYPHPQDPTKSLEEWYRIKIPRSSSVGYIETFWVNLPAPAKNC